MGLMAWGYWDVGMIYHYLFWRHLLLDLRWLHDGYATRQGENHLQAPELCE